MPLETLMSIERRIDLRHHPSERPRAVRAISVLLSRSRPDELRLTFRMDADLSGVLIPPPRIARIASGLWRHTCFEVFVAVEGQTAYHEFNFAPSGEWGVYAFCGYRDGRLLADEMMQPNIAVRSSAGQLELDSVVRLDRLSAVHTRAPLRIGFSAVVETSGGLSYWALHHPPDKPDFHHADGFALRVQAWRAEVRV